tara:strand:+ start:1106 stop:1819 length:714 start_codon:yes stop_codon:yes gene_type:complete
MEVLNRKYNWAKENARRKSVKVFVFRHGHTSFNEKHKFCGWKNSRLTKNGLIDAKKISRKLRSEKIDLAFHSSLSRSRRTMEIVVGFHKECHKKICDDRLIERCYGDLQGKTHSAYAKECGENDLKKYLQWHKSQYLDYNHSKEFVRKFGERDLLKIRRSYSARPPNGESIKDVEKRVNEFLKDLLKICKLYKVNVALSVHGNSMRPIRKYFENLSTKEMMHLENPWDKAFVYEVKV